MKSLTKENRILLLLIFLLIIPAFYTNITRHTMIHDESLRSLVALEMKLSGDYITPTIGARPYFKKPPVYNWIIAGYFKLTGDYSERATRIPMLLSLLLFSLSIYYITKRRYSKHTAIIAALLYLIYPRIIIYESLYGLIDITYSWVVFLTFIFTYELLIKQKYLQLFLITYTLSAVSFMMKGIPSIAYQGITLFIAFTITKNFKKLFTWKHLVGALPLFILTGSYYYAYYLKNPDLLKPLLTTIFNESADKSAVAFGFWRIIKHIYSYSIEILYNYLPGTFVLLFLFNKKAKKIIKSDPFVMFLLLAFIGNISIYLISPVSYMRYVLPHVGLLIIAFSVIYYKLKTDQTHVLIRSLDIFFLVVVYLILLAQLAYGFVPDFAFIPHRWLKIAAIALPLAGVILWFHKKRQYRLELFIFAMLIFKLSFNTFILPARMHNDYKAEMRDICLDIGKEFKGKKVHVIHNIVRTTQYYLTVSRMEIWPYSSDTTDVDYLVGYNFHYDISDKKVVYAFDIEMTDKKLKIIKW